MSTASDQMRDLVTCPNEENALLYGWTGEPSKQ